VWSTFQSSSPCLICLLPSHFLQNCPLSFSRGLSGWSRSVRLPDMCGRCVTHACSNRSKLCLLRNHICRAHPQALHMYLPWNQLKAELHLWISPLESYPPFSIHPLICDEAPFTRAVSCHVPSLLTPILTSPHHSSHACCVTRSGGPTNPLANRWKKRG
jgi:hypothetical protein